MNATYQIERIQKALKEMTIGMTSVKWDIVVTRLAEDLFEIVTLGNPDNCNGLHYTANHLCYMAARGYTGNN